VHEDALARLDSLEEELDALSRRPSGAQSIPLQTGSQVTAMPSALSATKPVEHGLQKPRAAAEPTHGRLVALIPKLVTASPILEAEVSIVQSATPRPLSMPALLPAPDASAEPVIPHFGAHEATVAIVARG
jgi:hypothetical protein